MERRYLQIMMMTWLEFYENVLLRRRAEGVIGELLRQLYGPIGLMPR